MIQNLKNEGWDEDTLNNLETWFYSRNIITDDPFANPNTELSKWARFYQMYLRKYKWQYYQLLRLESTEWDPMVADYMERQILRNNEGSVRRDGSTLTKGKVNSSNDSGTTTTVKGKTVVDGTENTTESGKKNTNTTLDHTESGNTTTSTDTVNGGKDEVSQTHNNNTSSQNTNVVDSTTKSDTKGLTGTTPDSSIYGGTFPENFNWNYTSGQTESMVTQDTDTTTTDTGSGTDSGTQNTTTTFGGTQNVDTTGTSQSSLTGDDSVNETSSGTVNVDTDTTTTDESTTTVKGNGSANSTSETNVMDAEDTTTTSQDDTRERYTGRHESPQDLMERARNYIMLSNAFGWLTDKMDKCFIAVFD